jgi:hypothetical protein
MRWPLIVLQISTSGPPFVFRAARDLGEAGIVLVKLCIVPAVKVELVLVLSALTEDQIPIGLLIAIHVVLIALRAPQPPEGPVPPMPDYLIHLSSPFLLTMVMFLCYVALSTGRFPCI